MILVFFELVPPWEDSGTQIRNEDDMTERTNLCADGGFGDVGQGCLLLLHPSDGANAVLQPWQEDH